MIRFVCPCGFDSPDLLEFEEHCAHTHGQTWLLKYTEPARKQRIRGVPFAASMMVRQGELGL